LVTPYPLLSDQAGYWQCLYAKEGLAKLYEAIQERRGRRDMPGPVLILLERIETISR
jgi:hypothetical protein